MILKLPIFAAVITLTSGIAISLSINIHQAAKLNHLFSKFSNLINVYYVKQVSWIKNINDMHKSKAKALSLFDRK